MIPQVGQIVRVARLSDNGGEGNFEKEERSLEKYVGQCGIVKAIISKSEWSVGESAADPLIVIRFRKLQKNVFWQEELEVVEK